MVLSSPTLDVARLRALVRDSAAAVGLIGLRRVEVVELSAAAASLTGFRPGDDAARDLAGLTADPESIRRTLALLAEGVLDECRIWTTMPERAHGDRVLVSLRAVARDTDQTYVIARFGAGSTGHVLDGVLDPHALEDLVASDGDATGASGPPDHRDRLAELEQRFRRIAHEIDAAGLLGYGHLDWEPDAFPELDDLTSRQSEILTRLLHGERVPTISRGMHLSASTVRNHLATIYRKLGVHSQAELIERVHGVTKA